MKDKKRAGEVDQAKDGNRGQDEENIDAKREQEEHDGARVQALGDKGKGHGKQE